MKIKKFKFPKLTTEVDESSKIVTSGSPAKRLSGRGYGLIGFVILFGAFGTITVLKNFADSTTTSASLNSANSNLVKLHGLGAIAPPANVNTHQALPNANTQQTLPQNVDLTRWAAPVGNQGDVGSCVAWAVDHNLFGWYVKKDGYSGGLHAPMYTYAQIVKGQNVGTTPQQNFQIAESQGIDTEADYYQGDYNYTAQPTAEEMGSASHYKINSNTNLFMGTQPGNNNQLLLEQQLASGAPAVIILPVYPEFDDANSTDSLVGTPTSGQVSRGYHEVTALGYNAQGLVIENQWGTGWGNKGYATLSWAFVNNYVLQADAISGITVTPNLAGNLAYTSSSAIATNGAINSSLGIAPGTSPSVTPLANNQTETVFHGANGDLWIVGTDGVRDSGLGMAAGTSPSIHGLLNGSYEIAFHAANGDLWTAGSFGTVDSGLGMAAGSSPSITAIGSYYEIAFHAANGDLWTAGEGGGRDWGLGMEPGTSPTITGLWTGGIEMAINAANGDLWTAGNLGASADSGLGMYPGTSPSITPVGDYYIAAFHAANGDLWTAGYGGGKDWSLGMEPGTSPSIVTLSGGGVQMAFMAAGTYTLWTTGNDGTIGSTIGTAAWTSPSIAPTSNNGYDVGYAN